VKTDLATKRMSLLTTMFVSIWFAAMVAVSIVGNVEAAACADAAGADQVSQSQPTPPSEPTPNDPNGLDKAFPN